MNQETGTNNQSPTDENDFDNTETEENLADVNDDGLEHIDDSDEEHSDDHVDEQQQRIEDLEAQLAQSKEDLIRMAAEMDNLQKRLERDIQNTRKFSNEKIIKALLPVMDSFDKALELVDKDDCEITAEQMVEGTQMTQKIFAQVLKDYGVQIVDPLGEKFDPELHEAMSMVEVPDQEKNTIIDVFQKGYVLNDRVIKAAMVVVAK